MLDLLMFEWYLGWIVSVHICYVVKAYNIWKTWAEEYQYITFILFRIQSFNKCAQKVIKVLYMDNDYRSRENIVRCAN